MTSDDGLLTISMTRASADGALVTATAVTGDHRPSELQELVTDTTAYRVVPDGLRSRDAVTVTRTIDLWSHGIAPTGGPLPVMLLAVRESEGSWRWLDDQVLWFDGSTLAISGRTDRLGMIASYQSGCRPRVGTLGP